MANIYKKRDPQKLRKIIRYCGLTLSLFSFFSLVYIASPLISWAFFFEPVFAANKIHTPIPKNVVLTEGNIQTLVSSAINSLNVDYTDAKNWFPQYRPAVNYAGGKSVITTFNISVPKLGINYANVSTVDTDLLKHLILYPGTVTPPEKGNAVIFGHSTIPSWFNPKDYKTIFATAHKLKEGDYIYATVNAKEYHYKITAITVTTPDDTTIFAQDTSDSYLTLVTCTPPGTTWKRLIIKAKLEI